MIPQTYNASFYIQAGEGAKIPSGISVSLRANRTNRAWVSKKIPSAKLSTTEYTQLSTQIRNRNNVADLNNTFAVTFDASEVAGSTFYIGLLSLFGETFKNQPNGMRKDLAQHIYDLKHTFLRFPGGNNVEGETIDQRWKWFETVGPLIDRPGRLSD